MARIPGKVYEDNGKFNAGDLVSYTVFQGKRIGSGSTALILRSVPKGANFRILDLDHYLRTKGRGVPVEMYIQKKAVSGKFDGELAPEIMEQVTAARAKIVSDAEARTKAEAEKAKKKADAEEAKVKREEAKKLAEEAKKLAEEAKSKAAEQAQQPGTGSDSATGEQPAAETNPKAKGRRGKKATPEQAPQVETPASEGEQEQVEAVGEASESEPATETEQASEVETAPEVETVE